MPSLSVNTQLNTTSHFSEGGCQNLWCHHLDLAPDVVCSCRHAHRKKSGGVRSGDLGGHSPREITLSGKNDSTSAMLTSEVWLVAPSCW
jgi:hypothetical protein